MQLATVPGTVLILCVGNVSKFKCVIWQIIITLKTIFIFGLYSSLLGFSVRSYSNRGVATCILPNSTDSSSYRHFYLEETKMVNGYNAKLKCLLRNSVAQSSPQHQAIRIPGVFKSQVWGHYWAKITG